MTDDYPSFAPEHWATHANWEPLHELLEQLEDAAATAKTVVYSGKPHVGQLAKVFTELSDLLVEAKALARVLPGYPVVGKPAVRAPARPVEAELATTPGRDPKSAGQISVTKDGRVFVGSGEQPLEVPTDGTLTVVPGFGLVAIEKRDLPVSPLSDTDADEAMAVAHELDRAHDKHVADGDPTPGCPLCDEMTAPRPKETK